MLQRPVLTLALAASVAFFPVTRVAADAGDLMGGIVGGIIGGAIVNQSNKRTTTRTVYRPVVVDTQRAENREVQTSLNYFGFPAGTPDGVLGRNSRNAITNYQIFLGTPPTGQLTPFERTVLVGAYDRGQSGAFDAMQLMNTDPLGARALLVAQRDMMTGTPTVTVRRTTGYAGLPIEVSVAIDEIADSSDPSAEQLLQRSGFIQLADLNGDGNNDYILDTSFSGSSFWCNAVQCKSLVFVSTAKGYVRNDLLVFDPTPASFDCIGGSCIVARGTTMVATDPTPQETVPQTETETVLANNQLKGSGLQALPLLAAPTRKASLGSHCSKISLLTNANGGFTNVSTMADPVFVLNEQFCLARTYAMDSGERIVADLQGLTQDTIDTQCAAYGSVMKEYVSGLSLKSRDEMVREVGGFVLSSGLEPEQLALTAKICLATGYRKDDLDIALGSALLLSVLGEPAYGELIGHHLSQGFGASKRVDLALPWYQDSLDALASGATPVFAPNQPDRSGLLQEAVFQLGGGNRAGAAPVDTAVPTGLPTFKFDN